MKLIQFVRPFVRSGLVQSGNLPSTRLRTACAPRLLTLLLLLTLPSAVQAQFTFTTNNGAITITSYTGTNPVVVIPSTINGLPVTSIGGGVFTYSSSLTSVTIPDTVTNIWFGTLAACSSLTAITVGTNNPAFSSLDGVLFDKSQATLVQYPAGKVASYIVPKSVTELGADAFYAPGGATNIYFSGNAPSLGNQDVFYNDYHTTVYYLPGTTGWGATIGSGPGCPTVLVDTYFILVFPPASQTVNQGDSTTISASVFGPPPLFYQWRFNGTGIALATNSTYSITNARLADAGSYTVVITNSLGCITSQPAILQVLPSPGQCVSPPAGMVAWWPGEGNANDIAGTNNGVLEGGVAFATGEVGKAFSFDGVSGYITNGMPGLTNILNSYTMEFWAWPMASRASTPEGTAGITGASNQRYAIFPDCGATGLAGAGVSVGTNGVSIFERAPAYLCSLLVYDAPIVGWTHIAVVFENRQPTLYVNGALVRTGLTSGPAPYPSTGLGETGLGYGYYAGLLDEVSIYTRTLSATEIAAIYNAGSAGKCRLAPTPRTATATATVVNGFVVGATITDGGYGYTNTPIVKIIGGGGSGAQAVAVVSNGVVIAVNVLDAGSGYTSTSLVVIDPPFIPNPVLDIAPMSFLVFSNLTLGGVYQLQQWVGWYWSNQPVSFTATNALYTQMVAGVADSGDYRLALNPVPAQAFATAQVVNGFVVGATVTSGGSGYVTSPAVTIVGAGGTNATAVSHISGGVVTSISIFDAGNGYTNAPTVRIAPPPAAAVSPTVLPVMRVDSANLAPYDNYQIQFKSDIGGAWGNWDGGLFSPTDVTNSQYLFITNAVGFFRLQYVP